MKFLSQGSDLSHSCGNTGSFNPLRRARDQSNLRPGAAETLSYPVVPERQLQEELTLERLLAPNKNYKFMVWGFDFGVFWFCVLFLPHSTLQPSWLWKFKKKKKKNLPTHKSPGNRVREGEEGENLR